MAEILCPKCGHQVAREATACSNCGQDMRNGAVPGSMEKPIPPPEVSSWVIEKVPPDLLAWARQTFNMEEYLAGVRQIEETGGLELKDFIDEIEAKVKGSE
jgi:hypothetical protein